MVNQISVADIDVAGRLRPVDQEHAELLAVSIKETGLKHPIVIRPSADGPKAYKLVVGGHRLAALQRLTLRDLVVGEHVIIQDLNDDEARLAEIDENLIRHELNALDRAISFLERKRLYEKLYPETGHGKAPKAKSQTLRLFRERFSRATAKKLGLSERLVQLSVDLASRLDPQAVASLPRSLRRWRTLRSEGQIGRLAVDRGATRRGKGKLDQPEVRAWILGWIAHKPHTTGDSLHGYLKTQFPDLKVSIRSAERALSTLKEQEKVALTRITNPDAWKSKYEPSGENSNPATRLNELWMIDASPADVMLKDGRHHIYACIDRYSRRTIIYVTKTPRAEAVCLLLRRAFLAWGVPERIKTDNGSDFKARRTVGLMLALEIEVNVARAYDPKAKAHVERVIKTFQHEKAADLSGFIGHSVADRKVIEERKSFAERQGQSDDDIFHVELDAKAFQAECDHWASITYEHRRHDPSLNDAAGLRVGGLVIKANWAETPALLDLQIYTGGNPTSFVILNSQIAAALTQAGVTGTLS